MPEWVKDALKNLADGAATKVASALETMAGSLPENLKQQFTELTDEINNSLFKRPENKPQNKTVDEEKNQPKKKSLLELLLELLKLSMSSPVSSQISVQQFDGMRQAIHTICNAVSNQLANDYKAASQATTDAYQNFGTDPNSYQNVNAAAFTTLGLDKNIFLETVPQNQQVDAIRTAYEKQHAQNYTDYSGQHKQLWDAHTQTQNKLDEAMGIAPNNKAAEEQPKSTAPTPFDIRMAPKPPGG